MFLSTGNCMDACILRQYKCRIHGLISAYAYFQYCKGTCLIPHLCLIINAKIDHTPKTATIVCHYTSLVPRPPLFFFVPWFAFSIIHCVFHFRVLYWTQTKKEKSGEAWKQGYHYTEFKLSGVASLCWLGVHHGIPKECETWCHDKLLALVLMATADVNEESSRRDGQYCIIEVC